jgi:hypothetical protein
MLNKSFVAIAMLSFIFTATAFGQKEIVSWSQAKGAKNVERKTNSRTPRQTAFTGSDEELGALIAWKQSNQKPGRKPKAGSLIDTSTGEIVWADEAKATPQPRAMQKPKGRNLIDTSTGEIVWAKGNHPNSSNTRQVPGATPKGISFNFDKMAQVQRNQLPRNFSAGQDARMDSQRTMKPRRPQKR